MQRDDAEGDAEGDATLSSETISRGTKCGHASAGHVKAAYALVAHASAGHASPLLCEFSHGVGDGRLRGEQLVCDEPCQRGMRLQLAIRRAVGGRGDSDPGIQTRGFRSGDSDPGIQTRGFSPGDSDPGIGLTDRG